MPDMLFLQILNMSLTGGFAVLFVLLARAALYKAPKKFVYPLWGLVLFRLCCPFSLESIFSFVPSKEVFPTELLTSTNRFDWQIQSGFTAIDQAVNPVLMESSPSAMTSRLSVLAWIWLAGAAGMLLYSLISFIRLRQKLVGRVRLQENIYLADHIVWIEDVGAPEGVYLGGMRLYNANRLRSGDEISIGDTRFQLKF